MAKKATKKKTAKKNVAEPEDLIQYDDIPQPQKRYTEVKASVFDKTVALAIDLLILLVVTSSTGGYYLQRIVPYETTRDQIEQMMLANPEFRLQLYLFAGFITLVALIYFIAFEWRLGSTIGKGLMKLKVVSTNKQIKPWQYMVRNISLFLPLSPTIFLPAFVALDVVYQFFNKENQRVLERLSGTKVVKKVEYEG